MYHISSGSLYFGLFPDPDTGYRSFSADGGIARQFAQIGPKKYETLIQARVKKKTKAIVENKFEEEILLGPKSRLRVVEHRRNVRMDDGATIRNYYVAEVEEIRMTLDDDFRRERLERYRAEARERLGEGASEEEIEKAAWSRWRAMLSRFGSAAFVKRQLAADEEFRKRGKG